MEWKVIPCTNNNYECNEFGQIRKVGKEELKSTYADKQGYERVGVYFDCKDHSMRVHNLIMNAFYGEKPFDKAEINHIDGNKMNNSLDNLEWCTAKENSRHSVESGLYPSGERHYNSKYKQEDILEMYKLYKNGNSVSEIASLYNNDYRNVIRIVHGDRWNRTYQNYFENI